MSRRAVILSAVPVSTALCRYVQPDDFVVACDAGYRNAERLDLRPDLIVGDFDSAPQPKTEHETIVLPHVKDDTDTSMPPIGCWSTAMTRSPCWALWAGHGWSTRWPTLPPDCILPKTA